MVDTPENNQPNNQLTNWSTDGPVYLTRIIWLGINFFYFDDISAVWFSDVL